MDQNSAPFYEALLKWRAKNIIPFHTPGHKGRLNHHQSIFTSVGLGCDLPSMKGTDYIFNPTESLFSAQELAASIYEASHTFFLGNGATIGIHAMMLSTLMPGTKVLIDRASHVSVFSGLVISGAVPVFLHNEIHPQAGPLPVTAEMVKSCLINVPDIKAVLLTRPTYYGVCCDLQAISNICKRKGVLLLVDEAHGCHFRWISKPSPALNAGADMVVQSVHKMLGSLVGTAQLHIGKKSLVCVKKVQKALNLLQSTSTNMILLASLDLTRRWAFQHASNEFSKSLALVNTLKNELLSIKQVNILTEKVLSKNFSIDPFRLTLDFSQSGLCGKTVENKLEKDFGILVEFSDFTRVILVLGPADQENDYLLFASAVRKIVQQSEAKLAKPQASIQIPLPEVCLTPREAYFSPKKAMPISDTLGEISGETVSSYPPGIPIIAAGERISKGTLTLLKQLAESGSDIIAEDTNLRYISVVNGGL